MSDILKVKQFLKVKFDQKSIDYDEESDIGIVKGYASTFDNIDRGDDLIERGAFDKTIASYKTSGRPIRMLWQHNTNDLIGGYPADKMYVDEKGLFVVGEINLKTQRGKEAYALAKQGVLSDFSIGYFVDEFEIEKEDDKLIRKLKEVELFEISLVGEPMNTEARFTEVKSVVPFQDLPLADVNTKWNSRDAKKRIREFTKSSEKPSDIYKNAFLYYDKNASDLFESYKLPIADVIDDELKVIPRAIFAAAAVLNGARGGIDLPTSDVEGVKANINRYYKKMDMESPLVDKRNNQKNKVDIDEKIIDVKMAETISTKRDFERTLRETGCFTRKALEVLASRFKEDVIDNQSEPDISKKQSEPVDTKGLAESLAEIFKQFEK